MDLQAILTDIEGTTSSLSFVKDVLFPYARRHLPDYVRAHREEPKMKAILEDVRIREEKPSLDEEAIIGLLCRWIDDDRKLTPLKALQGYIWEEGYRGHAFRGHVYDDAVAHMRAWGSGGLRLFVYSSGSVAAQKLLFEHTTHGDLRSLFSGFFDTTTGAKRDVASYVAIASAIGIPAQAILFLSDTEQELDAARAAGMATTWLNRDGQSGTRAPHTQARTFDDIDPFLPPRGRAAAKRSGSSGSSKEPDAP